MSTKKALCVGINDYPGTGSDLAGCVNDANDWAELLRARGYSVKTLLDAQATLAGMTREITTLVQDARAGDSLVFQYSGHGSWLPDDDGDEADGRDEMLCPHDVSSGAYLMDDTLAEIFGRKAAGVNLYFISDSCHSGSVSRFNPALTAEARDLARPRFLPPETLVKTDRERTLVRRIAEAARRSTKQKYPALLFAGCRDIEFSYDATFGGRPNGAFTRVAIDALKQHPASPYEWMLEIRKHLPTASYPQRPQLYGGRNAKRGPLF